MLFNVILKSYANFLLLFRQQKKQSHKKFHMTSWKRRKNSKELSFFLHNEFKFQSFPDFAKLSKNGNMGTADVQTNESLQRLK